MGVECGRAGRAARAGGAGRRALVGGVVLCVAVAPAARASSVRVQELGALSAANPFPGGRCQADEDVNRLLLDPLTQEDRDTELEPSIAVDPRDARTIVATWELGRSPQTTVYGAASSSDGGTSWSLHVVPGLSRCTGGDPSIAQDPGVSFAPDGTAYLASQAFIEPDGAIVLAVNRSRDGGNSWSQPAMASRGLAVDKQKAPVAGGQAPGVAAIAFPVERAGDFSTRDLFFSETADGGATWSLPRPIYLAPRAGLGAVHPILETLPDGTLLVSFALAHITNYVSPDAPQERHEILAMRSTDGGRSWSAPTTIAQTGPLGPGLTAADPDTGRAVVNIPHNQLAVGPDGSVYVTWHDIESSDTAKVLLARSRDGGVTWDPPWLVARTAGALAMLPSVAVMPDGTVGVSWYDTRRDRRGDGELTTDYWFAHSHDGGASWDASRVAGPFDLNAAPERSQVDAVDFPLGEYTGLAALPGGFATAFAMGRPQASFGYADVFFARLQLDGTVRHDSRSAPSVSPRNVGGP